MNKFLNLFLIALVFISGLLVFLGATYILAHGGDDDLIHACVRNTLLPNAPNIRIISATDTCSSNETALDWPKTANSGGGSQFIVVDSQDTEVGSLIGLSSILREIDNYWVDLSVNSNGFTQQSSMYVSYESSDCSGTPNLPADGISRHGNVIGNKVYYASDPLINHYNSYREFTPPNSYGDCQQDSVDIPLGSVVSYELPPFIPPFTLRSNP